jgi:tetratricopeptide (TPR) repeat protein
LTTEVESEVHAPAPASFLEFISGDVGEANSALGINLIDDFLKGPDVERKKTEFFNPEKMAKKSLDDSEGLVSDTLARIYMSQGNYAKAIDAYERLILKYPEKSGYFAARIEKVEDLQRIKRK